MKRNIVRLCETTLTEIYDLFEQRPCRGKFSETTPKDRRQAAIDNACECYSLRLGSVTGMLVYLQLSLIYDPNQTNSNTYLSLNSIRRHADQARRPVLKRLETIEHEECAGRICTFAAKMEKRCESLEGIDEEMRAFLDAL